MKPAPTPPPDAPPSHSFILPVPEHLDVIDGPLPPEMDLRSLDDALPTAEDLNLIQFGGEPEPVPPRKAKALTREEVQALRARLRSVDNPDHVSAPNASFADQTPKDLPVVTSTRHMLGKTVSE